MDAEADKCAILLVLIRLKQGCFKNGEKDMWLQACLNGSRTSTERTTVPLAPKALAAEARCVMAVGISSLHVHPRDTAGLESLTPDAVSATLTAIREACPGLEIGISTAAYIEPDPSLRLELIESWTVLPDFVSVNLSEPGIDKVMTVLLKQGVALEAGIWTAEDARHLLILTEVEWLRLLLEPWDSDPEQANIMVDAIEKVLGDALPHVPRLVHGTDGAAWALLERAYRDGHVSRIGLEDTLLLPTGEPASDNVSLVRAAKILTEIH